MKSLILFFVLLAGSFSVFGQDFSLVGKFPAPNLKFTTIDGKTIDTAELKGKVVVYNFWFVGCPPCMQEIPELNEIVAQYKDKDVVFLGLSSSNKKDLDNFLKKNPFNYQIVSDAAAIMLGSYGEASKDGNVKLAFPTHVVVNRQGYVEVKMTGLKGVEAVRQQLKREFPTQ
ncbi:MAG TPA: TlpA disulfide reductase family protein [Pyrinomonadaceae bacterium]|nr:TlpA disulfide reductase family protein [Pyrinomonadaceae bacterium]